MAENSDQKMSPINFEDHPRLFIHFLDYSTSEFAALWKEETKKKQRFKPNRQNIALAIWNHPSFSASLSGMFDREKSQFVPIPLETFPFFQNYIDGMRKIRNWKEAAKQEVSDELLNDIFQNAYDSIKASPDALAYYEKILCHTDVYCRFAASKVWEEELDYRINLLKELLSKHSGRTQLDGLANLLRTLDMYIAVYSKPPEKKEPSSAEGYLQEILDSLMDLRWKGKSAKPTTAFWGDDNFPRFDSAELKQEPLTEQDAAGLNNRPLITLEFMNYIIHSKKRFSKELRSNAVKIARKKYLTSRVSEVESTPFWDTYQDMKHYLDSFDSVPSKEYVNEIAKSYLSHYYKEIWSSGTLSLQKPFIEKQPTIYQVSLDALAKSAAESFIQDNSAALYNLSCVKKLLSSHLYSYSPMIPFFRFTTNSLQQLTQGILDYIGNSFKQEFTEKCSNGSELFSDPNTFCLTLFDVFSEAGTNWSIQHPNTVQYHSLLQDFDNVLRQIQRPNFENPVWNTSNFYQISYTAPVLDYIIFMLKLYYDVLDATEDVATVFWSYHSYMEKKSTAPPKK